MKNEEGVKIFHRQCAVLPPVLSLFCFLSALLEWVSEVHFIISTRVSKPETEILILVSDYINRPRKRAWRPPT